MINFEYQNTTKLIFGKDEHKEIGKIIKPYSDNILIVYGSDRIKDDGLFAEITESLKDAKIDYTELGGVVPNPRISLVRKGINLCRAKEISFVLAIGGGSVIDTAKTIAVGSCYTGDVWDFFDKGLTIRKALDVATILTIPAAGSESSSGAVITNEETFEKKSIGSELIRPAFSIVNPEFFYSIPKNQIANGLCDMMSHIFERYFTNTADTELIDGMAESVLKTILNKGKLLLETNKNYEAWADIGLAGSIAHNGILGLGREGEWACHAMEHQLSAYYDIPHGAGLAILTPAWMRYTYNDNLKMFRKFAVNVMGVKEDNKNDQDIINEGIDKLQEFFISLGLPKSFSEVNIDDSKIELMAQNATEGNKNPLGNFKKLYIEDVKSIYNMVR